MEALVEMKAVGEVNGLEEKLHEAGIKPELNREDVDREVAEMVSSCEHNVDAAVGPHKYLGPAVWAEFDGPGVNGRNLIGLVEPMWRWNEHESVKQNHGPRFFQLGPPTATCLFNSRKMEH
nr:hypothetical protein [Tanacetum cinerariifolium]